MSTGRSTNAEPLRGRQGGRAQVSRPRAGRQCLLGWAGYMMRMASVDLHVTIAVGAFAKYHSREASLVSGGDVNKGEMTSEIEREE